MAERDIDQQYSNAGRVSCVTSDPLRLTFPYGLGKFHHLVIGQNLEKGRYLVERLVRGLLLQPAQVSGRVRLSPMALHIKHSLQGSTPHSVVCPWSKISKCRTVIQVARQR